MSSNRSLYNLFGIDVRSICCYFRDGWMEALDWRIFRWLRPRRLVRVRGADGVESVRLGCSTVQVKHSSKVVARALELPEDYVLRRVVTMPYLADSELADAVALEVRTASPFGEGDTAWGFARRGRAEREIQRIEIVLCSKICIARHLAEIGDVAGPDLEIWAGGETPVVIEGYGDIQGGRREWFSSWLTAFLLLFFVALVCALAATPLLQLRLALFDAVEKYERLVKSSSRQVSLRSDLIVANDELGKVREFVKVYPDPMRTLDELSALLPDDTMLSFIEIKDGSARISGVAANSARLLDMLAMQPGYEEVKAPIATSRVHGANKESFTIEFKVKRGEIKP